MGAVLGSEIILSIICCTHNRLVFVQKHFEQLRHDLPEQVELIYALDNCSDGTQAYLQQQAGGMPNVRVLDYRGPGGLFHCRNHGFEHSNGRYIHYLDDDDSVESGYHRQLRTKLQDQRLRGIDAYITGMTIEISDGSKTLKAIVAPGLQARAQRHGDELHVRGDLFTAVLRGEIYFNCANAIFSRGFLERHRFRGEFKKSADWLLYLEAALSGDLHLVVNETLRVNYYIHELSMSVAPDKSHWNARIFDQLLSVTPKASIHRPEVRAACAKANFEAGYASRRSDKRSAMLHYAKAISLGFVRRPLTGLMKLPLQ
jgi:glycosyltransferase involved in cell wall biosynthesis